MYMTYDVSTPMGVFLDAAAARQATPGGGAVAALTGALAATMAEMVLNYSVNKKGLEHYQSELKPALAQVHAARKMFEQLMVEDQTAYEAVSLLRKLPPDSPERQQKWPEAIDTSIKVPQAILATAASLLELCDNIINFVNPMLLSDLAVATDLAMATARCAVYNVKINLPELKDEASRTAIEVSLNELLLKASRVIQGAGPRIWARVEQG